MKSILKWVGIAVGVLVALVVIAGVALHFVGSNRLAAADVTVASVTVPEGEEAIERGRHLAAISGCQGCHEDDWSGRVFIDEAPIGYVSAPNLTSGKGGIGGTYTDEDWAGAIRHGVAKDGRTMVTMPSEHYTHYGDEDLGNLIAYLKSLPAVDNELGTRNITFPGTIIFGVFAYSSWPVSVIDHDQVGGNAPPVEASAEYGAYLVDIASCTSCHGENLAGNTPDSDSPMGPNITMGGELQGWSEADFFTAMREGVTPTGRQLSDEMLWRLYADMSDTELRALWTYLGSLEPLPANAP